MEKINEITIPKGVDRLSVKQYDDKIVFEFIPEEPKFKIGEKVRIKKGDLAICWDGAPSKAMIRFYGRKHISGHYDTLSILWKNAIKFESKEQFEKVLKGEIN